MKRVLAIIIILCMAFALFACNGNKGGNAPAGDGGGGSAPAGDGGGGAPAGDGGGGGAPAAGGSGPKEIGFWDRDYDYTQHKKFRIAYLVSATGFMYDTFDQSFAIWADRLNMTYNGIWAPAENSNEAFLSGVESYVDMGYDGLIFDMDPSLAGRVSEICAENNILWLMGMAQARDYSVPYSFNGTYSPGPLLAPNVGFNNIMVGREMASGLIQWKEDTFPEVPWTEVGFITVNFDAVVQLYERTQGCKQVWCEVTGLGEYNPDPTVNPRNFIPADASALGMDQATGTNLVTQILSNPPDPNIKVWLIMGGFFDYAMGASIAAENMGMIDNVCTTTFGGGLFVSALWEAGEPTTIRISLETASPVFAEAIINALWSMMAGFATPDTLWPEWQLQWDKGDVFKLTGELDPFTQVPLVERNADGSPVVDRAHGYASMILPMIWMTQDNYPAFYGWSDLYEFGPGVSDDARTYPQYPLATDINMFSARGSIPDYYHEWP